MTPTPAMRQMNRNLDKEDGRLYTSSDVEGFELVSLNIVDHDEYTIYTIGAYRHIETGEVVGLLFTDGAGPHQEGDYTEIVSVEIDPTVYYREAKNNA